MTVPAHILCPHCGAPSAYLYFNNGKKRTQVGCKVCQNLFSLPRAFQTTKKTKYYCPHCHHALYVWKRSAQVTMYKCGYHQCPFYQQRLGQLNAAEKKLQAEKSSQFKLRYQYRQYHFKAEQLQPSQPQPSLINLARIHLSENILGLVLAFHISFALSSRTTARILREVFQVRVSYQTVLNYSHRAAFSLHFLNLKYKGSVGSNQSGDETYIKIAGQHAYVFFSGRRNRAEGPNQRYALMAASRQSVPDGVSRSCLRLSGADAGRDRRSLPILFIAEKRRQITAYHVASNRGTLPATVTTGGLNRSSVGIVSCLILFFRVSLINSAINCVSCFDSG